MNLTEAVRACAVELLTTEDTVSTDKVVSCALSRYPDVFADEYDRLVMSEARRRAKHVMASLVDDDDDDNGQLTLPGLALPTAICVPISLRDPDQDGFEYVASAKANWPQLVAGRQLRADNVERARVKLAAYDESLALLQPVMEEDHTLSAADAYELVVTAALPSP